MATVGREIKQAQEQRLKGHLGTLRGEIKKAQSEIKQKIRGEIKEAQSEAKQEIIRHMDSEITVVRSHVGLVPVSFTMPNFHQKKSSNSPWYSPSFYTHPCGYKMCLRVDTNGWDDNGSHHVGVALFMMPGDYDDTLKWPFRGEITIQLLNQLGGHGHLIRAIPVTDSSADGFCNRVVAGERSPSGWGTSDFISHTSLLPTYLQNDCLKLCIKEIKITN